LQYFARWNGFIANDTDHFMRIDSLPDLKRVKKSGKIGIMLGLQNSEHFRRPEDVDFFRGLGQRVSQLTYNTRNLIGNGSTERRDEGISDFGVSIIERMNKLGMAVDVSHCGDRTTLDAFELSKKPVLITHSNCRALVPGHPRLKTDEAIKKVGQAGSVMGITGIIGPGLFSLLFAGAIGRYRYLNVPGAPFLVASLLLFAGAVIGYRLTRHQS